MLEPKYPCLTENNLGEETLDHWYKCMCDLDEFHELYSKCRNNCSTNHLYRKLTPAESQQCYCKGLDTDPEFGDHIDSFAAKLTEPGEYLYSEPGDFDTLTYICVTIPQRACYDDVATGYLEPDLNDSEESLTETVVSTTESSTSEIETTESRFTAIETRTTKSSFIETKPTTSDSSETKETKTSTNGEKNIRGFIGFVISDCLALAIV